MALTLNPATKQFLVLQADLNFVSGTFYELDTDAVRTEAYQLLASEDYIWLEDCYDHNAEYTVLGVTYSRKVEWINGYTIKLEDTGAAYTVSFVGSNNNMFDIENGILVPTPLVTTVGNNSAGLINLPKVNDLHGQVVRCVFVNPELLVNGNGYQQTPYNNWADAVDAAENQGLQILKLQTDADLDRDLTNFEIQGLDLPTVDLQGFDLRNVIIRECVVTGAQGTGNSPLLLLTCLVDNLTDFNGSMLTVTVTTGISMADGAFNLINQIVPSLAGSPWILDMKTGAAGSTVQVQNISGGVTVSNMDHADDVLHMGFLNGEVTIDASCTAGNLVLLGSVSVVDNSAGTSVVVVQPNTSSSPADVLEQVIVGNQIGH